MKIMMFATAVVALTGCGLLQDESGQEAWDALPPETQEAVCVDLDTFGLTMWKSIQAPNYLGTPTEFQSFVATVIDECEYPG